MLIHAFTVSFTIIVSTDLPLNYTQSKMVGAVGLAPTKAVRPGDLQSPAIAAMRCSQKIIVTYLSNAMLYIGHINTFFVLVYDSTLSLKLGLIPTWL